MLNVLVYFKLLRSYRLVKKSVKESDCPVKHQNALISYLFKFDKIYEETKKAYAFNDKKDLIAIFSLVYYFLDVQTDAEYFENRLSFLDYSEDYVDTENSWDLLNEFQDISLIAILNYGLLKLKSIDKSYSNEDFLNRIEHLKKIDLFNIKEEDDDFLEEYLIQFLLTESFFEIDSFYSNEEKKVQMSKLMKNGVMLFGSYEKIETVRFFVKRLLKPLIKAASEEKEINGYWFLKKIELDTL
jgi:hypothetical protein